jgi:hypothetical protein
MCLNAHFKLFLKKGRKGVWRGKTANIRRQACAIASKAPQKGVILRIFSNGGIKWGDFGQINSLFAWF